MDLNAKVILFNCMVIALKANSTASLMARSQLIVSMIRKNQSHKLQTNPWHREEESQQSRDTSKTNKAKQPALPSPNEVIVKLEWTESNAQQNKEQLQNPTMGVAINTNQQQQNNRLKTDSSQSHWGA